MPERSSPGENNVQRILLIKTSSMGDVVHNFPVVSDLSVRFPEAEIDWVVEEAFAALPPLHAMVRRVIPVALRRWRGSLGARRTWREIRTCLRTLRDRDYDAIIDTQGLLKSALVTACARGRKYGLDWASSREPIGWFYNRAFSIPWDRHAVERNRALAATALGYDVTGPASYALQVPAEISDRLRRNLPAHVAGSLQGRYAVLLHATSAAEKQWPEERWAQLGKALHAQGLACLLPFGSGDEQLRAERLASAIPGALVPPRLPLDETAALLADAAVVVGVDTGLNHLAAALGRPTVGIYCTTDPRATGLYGGARAVNAGTIGRAPDLADVLSSIDRVRAG
jgi:heptosyltransferase I